MNKRKIEIDVTAPMADFIVEVKQSFGDVRPVTEYIELLNRCELLVESNKHMLKKIKELEEETEEQKNLLNASKNLLNYVEDLKKAIHIVTA